MNSLQSTEIDQLMLALSKVHESFGVVIGKDAKGHKGTYAKQDTILSTIDERCRPFGLILTRKSIIFDSGVELLETLLFHIPSKQWTKCISRLNINLNAQSPDQVWGGSLTYHSRYDALSITGMCASDDPTDNDGWSNQQAEEKVGYINEKQLALFRAKSHGKEQKIQIIFTKLGIQDASKIPWNRFNDILEFLDK